MPSFSVLPGSEGFFIFTLLRAGLSTVKHARASLENRSRRTKLKDQHMKKKLFVSLALAGVFVIPTLTRAQFASSVVRLHRRQRRPVRLQ